jgi:hypothetical protein
MEKLTQQLDQQINLPKTSNPKNPEPDPEKDPRKDPEKNPRKDPEQDPRKDHEKPLVIVPVQVFQQQNLDLEHGNEEMMEISGRL